MPHDQGALMAWDKKEEARGRHGSRDKQNSRLREQRRSPETPPLGPPYKTNTSSPGPGLQLERPKARRTSILQPVVEKICVVRGPGGQMKKSIFHRESPRDPRRSSLLESGDKSGDIAAALQGEDWAVCTYVCICGGNLDGAVGCWS
jgi:hypothetical protein